MGFNLHRKLTGEVPAVYSKGSSGGYEERPLTAEELKFIETQDESLQQAISIAEREFNLSESDRNYMSQIYKGTLDANDPAVVAEVQSRMENLSPPTREEYISQLTTSSTSDDDGSGSGTTTTTVTDVFDDSGYEQAVKDFENNKQTIVLSVQQDLGTKGVDELLFESVRNADLESSKLLGEWETGAKELGSIYTDTLTNFSDDFKSKLSDTSSKLGTADTDIYAQTKAANLAGISQSYQEATKQAMGQLSRRGLAGSGVEANAIGNIAGQGALASSQALASSYQQAIGLSDQRRNQQLGIAGQEYQAGSATAGQVYQTDLGLSTSALQNQLTSQQQGIANLTTGSNIAAGLGGQASNLLGTAGQTAIGAAQSSGQMFGALAGNSSVYNPAEASKTGAAVSGAMTGAMGGALVGAEIGSVGGPWGAAIGGAVGLAGGLLS